MDQQPAPPPKDGSPSAPPKGGSPLAPPKDGTPLAPPDRGTTLAPPPTTPPSFPLPAHAPLRLDDAEARWIVEAGSVTLFATRPAAPPAKEGARRFLGSIGTGGLVCGLGEDLTGISAIAIGGAGTRLRPLSAEERASLPAAAIDAWTGALAGGVARGLEPRPRADAIALPKGPRIRLAAGEVVMAGESPVWLRINAGDWLLLGLERVQGLVPLPPGAWLTSLGAGVCRPVPTAEVARSSDWPAGLAGFNAALLEALPSVLALDAADELNRRRLAAAREAEAAHVIEASFGQVLGNAPSEATGSEVDPLMPVFRAVARHLGVAVRRPARRRALDVDAASTLEELARASSLRLRPVKLEPGWWKADHGVLFGRRADGAVVGLLPARGGWRICTPERPSGVRLDATTAAGLQADAWAPLLTLPVKKLALMDLLSVGMKGAGGDAAALVATMLIAAALGQALPMATGVAFTLLIPGGHVPELVQLGLALAVVATVTWVIGMAGEVARQRIEARAGPALHAAIWDRVIRQPLSVLKRQTVGETASRAGAAATLGAQIRAIGFGIASSVAVILSSAVLMLLSQPLAAAVGLGFLAVQLAAANLAGWLQGRAYATGEALTGLADAMVLQIVSGIVKLRLAGAEARAEAIWAERFAGMRRRLVAARRISNAYDGFVAGYTILAMAGAFFVIAMLLRVEPGRAPPSLASVMTFLSAYGLMAGAGTQLAKTLFALWMILPTRTFVRPLLETLPEASAGGVDPGRLTGALTLTNIAFRYGPSDPWVFQGLNLEVRAGEFIALTGRSGVGKSSLVRLLLGLEEAQAGAIYLDGHDLRGLDAGAVRRQVAAVLQSGRVPAGSLRDAVRGGTSADDAAIWNALERTALADEVRAMPMRLETMLTDAARVLSGGQAQRLLLARALVQKPALLVLDEATSALDNITQAKVMQAVRELPVTRLVIAHRLSTIRQADRIVVLEGGKVAESGRFEELVAKPNGLFARQFATEAQWQAGHQAKPAAPG